MDPWPQNVGIIAMEIVFPSLYVEQCELEKYDRVLEGKYTVGLGQCRMGVCTDRDDVNSLCLTAVSRLMENNEIDYDDIGRLEVGTETIIDKSKSVKTVLMQLFEESGNCNVEGIDTINACYGGTAALFNAIAWVESSAWDGRYAIVVAGDIAIYAKGNARATGGAGAIAMVIGPNAPLVIERVRFSHMKHAYDFYKPNLMSEYPKVDGKMSIECYLRSLDHCYQGYCAKIQKNTGLTKIDLNYFDFIAFHTPYCKLVQKSVARLMLNDFVRDPDSFPDLERYRGIKLEDTYFNREIENVFMEKSKTVFEKKTKPSLLLASEVGNMYTPSLYGGLISLLLSKNVAQFAGNRIGMFSYGSGFTSTLFSLKITEDVGHCSPMYRLMKTLLPITDLLRDRQKLSPQEFEHIMEIRERNHHMAPYTPLASPCQLFPGTWYLESIDEKHRRTYKRF